MTIPLTGAGLAVGSGSLGLLVLGLGTGVPALTATGAAGLLALLGGALAAGLRPRLQVQRVTATLAVSAGSEVDVRVEVRNTSRWLPVGGRLTEPITRRGRGPVPSEVPVPLPVVPPRGTRTVGYRVPARCRGVITLGPLRLDTGDPLSLVHRRSTVGDRIEVLVHPQVHTGHLHLGGAARSPDGVDREGAPTGSAAFHSLRSYVPGDDPRSIHWRSTARRGELVVRQHVDVVLPRLTVLLDTRDRSYPTLPDGDRPALEDAICIAASVVHAAVAREVALVLETTAGAGLAVDGPADVPSAMDLLARIEGDTGLGFAEVAGPRAVRPGAGLLVLTGVSAGLGAGQASAADVAALTTLARRHRRALVLTVGAGSGPLVPDGSVPATGPGPFRLAGAQDPAAALQVVSQWGLR